MAPVRKRAVIFIAIALVLGGVAIPFIVQHLVRSRLGPVHVFEVSDRPKYLTESLALRGAREALKREGLDTNAWQPVPHGRAGPRSGEQFVSRSLNNSNRVVIMFTNDMSMRFVAVELEGNKVTCQSSIGK
jgi:hypothetical protein